MTRDEIKNTPELVDFLLDESVIADSRKKLHERMDKICNLAIKVLEQQPCEDAISRQELLDAFWKLDIELRPNAIDSILNMINDISPVTPQPKTDVLDKVRAETAAIDINGQVDINTMFIRTGEQVKQMILEIIDKYRAVDNTR